MQTIKKTNKIQMNDNKKGQFLWQRSLQKLLLLICFEKEDSKKSI